MSTRSALSRTSSMMLCGIRPSATENRYRYASPTLGRATHTEIPDARIVGEDFANALSESPRPLPVNNPKLLEVLEHGVVEGSIQGEPQLIHAHAPHIHFDACLFRRRTRPPASPFRWPRQINRFEVRRWHLQSEPPDHKLDTIAAYADDLSAGAARSHTNGLASGRSCTRMPSFLGPRQLRAIDFLTTGGLFNTPPCLFRSLIQ